MPKEITHILIAKEVLGKLKESGYTLFSQALENNLHALYLGAIVPDALFYDVLTVRRISRDYSRLLRILHSRKISGNDEKAMSLFSSIGAAPFRWPLKVAFCTGIVTHTVSDRVIHGVIDYYMNRWHQKGTVAMVTHRQFETLVDMVLLNNLDHPASAFDLEGITQAQSHHKDSMLTFYLSHLMGGDGYFPRRLLHILKRANGQQLLFLRLFRINRLYHIVNRLNNLVAGRLEVWSSLFYPETVDTEAFPILKRLDLQTLTDGQTFLGSIPDLVQEIATQAVSLICDGLERL